jgi:hypothetical protein
MVSLNILTSFPKWKLIQFLKLKQRKTLDNASSLTGYGLAFCQIKFTKLYTFDYV